MKYTGKNDTWALVWFFFFQAEDGIRDVAVTGVQTCALPIYLAAPDRLIWLVVGAIVLWGVWAFGSELVLNLRLNHEVQTLSDGNAQLAASNEQIGRASCRERV